MSHIRKLMKVDKVLTSAMPVVGTVSFFLDTVTHTLTKSSTLLDLWMVATGLSSAAEQGSRLKNAFYSVSAIAAGGYSGLAYAHHRPLIGTFAALVAATEVDLALGQHFAKAATDAIFTIQDGMDAARDSKPAKAIKSVMEHAADGVRNGWGKVFGHEKPVIQTLSLK